jgi:hypothetical protein
MNQLSFPLTIFPIANCTTTKKEKNCQKMILLLFQVDTNVKGRNCHSAIRRKDVQSMIDLEINLFLETAPPPSAGNKLQVENQVD